MVPSTSEDTAAVYDPHDYDEVAMDEAATLSRSKPTESAVPGPVLRSSVHAPPAVPNSIPEIEDDGVYSVVSHTA